MLQIWLAAMQSAYPSFSPASADLDYVQATIIASWAASCAQLCTSGATALFRQFGTQLLNLPYEQGTSATAIITVTAQDANGYTLPINTQLSLTLSGATIAFQTIVALTIPNGQSSGTVAIAAVSTGTAANGASAPIQLLSQIDWVTGVSLSAPASGGVDQEDDDAYVQRLAATLQLLAPRPITASDYATMALNFQPAAGTDQEEVGRSTAIDGYDPLASEGGYQPLAGNTGTYGNEREVTVCVTDSTGLALNSDTMNAVGAYLAALREVNFIVNVVPPTYTTIYVAVTINPVAGYAASTIQANVQAALLAYLTPANFNLPQGSLAGWTNSQYVYLSRVSAVIQSCAGVSSIVTNTMAVDIQAPPSNTTNDLLLSGPFPLPLSTVTSIPLAGITVT
jgi:hypothetical protein